MDEWAPNGWSGRQGLELSEIMRTFSECIGTVAVCKDGQSDSIVLESGSVCSCNLDDSGKGQVKITMTWLRT